MEDQGFVGEGDVGESVFTVACCSVCEEADGDEVREVGFVLWVVEKFRNFVGEGEVEGGCVAAELLGLSVSSELSVVAA